MNLNQRVKDADSIKAGGRMTQQTEFSDGNIILRAKLREKKLREKEIVAAFYILTKAKIGDNLQMIIRKLPVWVKYKNDIKGIVKKLENLQIIKMRHSAGGRVITGISREAVLIANDFIDDFQKYKELLNDAE